MTDVVDRFAAASDPALPTVRLALEPEEVKRRFKRRLPRLAGDEGLVRVKGIGVVRHKPGRRCLLEYDLRVERPGAAFVAAAALGKIRARRYGNADYRLADELWRHGFSPAGGDGISIAEPLAVIPAFRMWLQRKVPGQPATALLASPDGVGLGRRVAEAAHKLHEAGVPAERRHTIDDELRILHDCLERVAAEQPRLERRLRRVLGACDRVGRLLPRPHYRPIHRDFYADQVIVDGDRLYVIDFDLYCEGDPALDAGNFLGHVTEQALRESGDPASLAPVEEALENRFCELAGERMRPAVRTYALLTLARHVYLSTLFDGRRHLTEPLLDLCEQLVPRRVVPAS
jgi:hypothetical protein